MAEPVHVDHDRDVRGSLDTPDAGGCVVACPPHPQMGGRRTDTRLRAVSSALAPDLACLRIDYGPWDGGPGERSDAVAAMTWARRRYDQIGLFGYSFGGGVALLAAAESAPAAFAVLAPVPRLDGLDTVTALDTIDTPGLVVYGEHDTTVDWAPVVERAESLGHSIASVPAGHAFGGQTDVASDKIATFLRGHLV